MAQGIKFSPYLRKSFCQQLLVFILPCWLLTAFTTLNATQTVVEADGLNRPSFSETPAKLESNEENAVREEAEVVDERLQKLEKELVEIKKAKSKLPSITVNGAFQADGVLVGQSDLSREVFGSIQNGGDFRRARLSAKGDVADNMSYFFQMDFGFFGRPSFTDVWVDLKTLPILGTFRVGQWKQPFGLEVVSSYRYTTMMERSSTFQAFTPFRHIGFGFYDHAEDLSSTWALSYFRTGQDQFGGSISTSGGNGLAGRYTRLFQFDGEDDPTYNHWGFGYFLNSPPRHIARFRSIPEIFVGEFAPGAIGTVGQAVPGALNGVPFFVDTGALTDVSLVNTFGVENLKVVGPLSMQSEAMVALVDQSASNDSVFWGSYTQLGWFITGEHRPYDRINGAIDRVKPRCDFGRDGGIGAWELTCRLSYIDLNNQTILGGEMLNLTTGCNWYINPYCKWVFNYIHSWTDSRDFTSPIIPGQFTAQTNFWGIRCQVDF
jgi:phosphate-selective porin OprO and OprP